MICQANYRFHHYSAARQIQLMRFEGYPPTVMRKVEESNELKHPAHLIVEVWDHFVALASSKREARISNDLLFEIRLENNKWVPFFVELDCSEGDAA